MIKDLPPPTEAEEYRNTAEKSCETWLLMRGSAGHATNSSIMPIISIGWPLLPSTDLELPSERFAPLSDGSVRSRADAAVTPVSGRPPSRVGAANFRHSRLAALAADVSASA